MNSKKRQQERGCRYSSLHSSDHPSIISSWMWLMKYHPCVQIAFPCGLIQPGTYSSWCANDHQLAASIHHTSIYEDSHSMPSHVWLIKHHNTCGAAENATPRTLLKPNTCLRQAGSGLISSVCLSGHQIYSTAASLPKTIINISSASYSQVYICITMVRLWKT